MPPQLAAQFTTGELAALRIVADAVRDRGACLLTLGEIAARAGVCVTTARGALRQAAREGLLTIEERRRDKRPNLPNVVRLISREWTSWIARGGRDKAQPSVSKGEGAKKWGPRIKLLPEVYMETALCAVTLPRTALADRPKATCSGFLDQSRLRRD
jgi:hypothetical protein